MSALVVLSLRQGAGSLLVVFVVFVVITAPDLLHDFSLFFVYLRVRRMVLGPFLDQGRDDESAAFFESFFGGSFVVAPEGAQEIALMAGKSREGPAGSAAGHAVDSGVADGHCGFEEAGEERVEGLVEEELVLKLRTCEGLVDVSGFEGGGAILPAPFAGDSGDGGAANIIDQCRHLVGRLPEHEAEVDAEPVVVSVQFTGLPAPRFIIAGVPVRRIFSAWTAAGCSGCRGGRVVFAPDLLHDFFFLLPTGFPKLFRRPVLQATLRLCSDPRW